MAFRYVSRHSSNAPIIIGDSSTRYLKFGGRKKTFGDKIPGKRVQSFLIEQIDPNSLLDTVMCLFTHSRGPYGQKVEFSASAIMI